MKSSKSSLSLWKIKRLSNNRLVKIEACWLGNEIWNQTEGIANDAVTDIAAAGAG